MRNGVPEIDEKAASPVVLEVARGRNVNRVGADAGNP